MTVKEIKFRPKTDVHDIDFKVKHILRFLDEGHRVKLTVFFRGREMAFKEKGFELLRKVVGLLGEAGVVDSNPKFEGRRLVMQLVPGGKGKKSATKGSDKSSPKKAPKKSEDSDIKGTSKNTDSPSSVKPQGASAN
jgi:translation initiation factor IF-3